MSFIARCIGIKQTHTEIKVSVQKKQIMSVQTELQRIQGVGAIASRATLATGIVTLVNGAVPLIGIKVTDIVDWSSEVYTAGTAEVTTVDLTAATLIANNIYSMTVRLPNTIAFFGGNSHATSDARESDAVYVTRTYTVSTDATPSATELAALFVGQINADLFAAFSATSALAVITITAQDATAGAFILNVSNMPGAVIAVTTANILPNGAASDVKRYVNADTVLSATYDRTILRYRKYIRHNAVKGNEVVKIEKLIVWSVVADGLPAIINPILDGTYLTVADYLGAPEVG